MLLSLFLIPISAGIPPPDFERTNPLSNAIPLTVGIPPPDFERTNPLPTPFPLSVTTTTSDDLTVTTCLIPGGCGTTGIERPEDPSPTRCSPCKPTSTRTRTPKCTDTVIRSPTPTASVPSSPPTSTPTFTFTDTMNRSPPASAPVSPTLTDTTIHTPPVLPSTSLSIPRPMHTHTTLNATRIHACWIPGGCTTLATSSTPRRAPPNHSVTRGTDDAVQSGLLEARQTESTICLMPPPFTCKTETETPAPTLGGARI